MSEPVSESSAVGVVVRVSRASMRQPFHGCDAAFIASTCHARCCRTTVHPYGVLCVVQPGDEARRIVERGGVLDADGLIVPKPGRKGCSFADGQGLCTLHGPAQVSRGFGDKPFGCSASPFTLTKRDALVVRNRYRLLPCYRAVGAAMACRSFRGSLVVLFGEVTADAICRDAESGSAGFFEAVMPRASYYALVHKRDASLKARR